MATQGHFRARRVERPEWNRDSWSMQRKSQPGRIRADVAVDQSESNSHTHTEAQVPHMSQINTWLRLDPPCPRYVD